MSQSLVFVFAAAPHSSALAREALDACLAASAVSDEVVVYFHGEGVWQLLVDQRPEAILQRHVLPTYGLLELYDVEQIYVDPQALTERGLKPSDLAIPVQALACDEFWARYAQAHAILRF